MQVLPTKPQHEVLYEIAVAERQRARADSERAGRVAAEATTVAASQTAARAKQVATQTKQETRKATARVEEANTVRKRLQKQLSTTVNLSSLSPIHQSRLISLISCSSSGTAKNSMSVSLRQKRGLSMMQFAAKEARSDAPAAAATKKKNVEAAILAAHNIEGNPLKTDTQISKLTVSELDALIRGWKAVGALKGPDNSVWQPVFSTDGGGSGSNRGVVKRDKVADLKAVMKSYRAVMDKSCE